MSEDIVSISRQEAEAAIRSIQQQSEIVHEAINKVERSPSSLPNWRGKSRREFEETVGQEMKRLNASANVIEESANRIQAAMVRLLRADGVDI